jgi:hypothetical protein
MTSLHKGWDAFTAAVGLVASCKCRVCGEDCTVERNVRGPTSWTDAMAGNVNVRHDTFICPNYTKDWHQQMRALKQEQEKTRSSNIRSLLEQEIALIFATKTTTNGWKDI